MSIEKNIQTVKDFFAAIGRGDRQGLLALVAEDIEWIVPGEDWPLAGTHRGHADQVELHLQHRTRRSGFHLPAQSPPELRGSRSLGVGAGTGLSIVINRETREMRR